MVNTNTRGVKKMKKTIKKIITLTTGISMVGATLLGAAASDLTQYPNPLFVKDGSFDGLIVIGADGETQDMLGAMDIISALQAETISGTISGDTETTTESTGDNPYKIEKSSNVLNVGESFSDVKNKIGEAELPKVLSDGVLKADGGKRYNYEQEVEFGSNLKFQHFADKDYNDDEPTMGVFIERGETILTYSLDFNKNVLSDIRNDKLEDLEDREIEILGEKYNIMDSYSDDALNKVTSIELMKGAVKSSIEEGSVNTHEIDGKEYEVRCLIISDTDNEVKFKINGEVTDAMEVGDIFRTEDGMTIGVREVMPNEAGDPTQDTASYYMGAKSIVLADGEELEIDNEDVEGVNVIIESPNEDEISEIKLVWEADEDIFIANNDSAILPGFESLKIYGGDFHAGEEEETEFKINGDDTVVLSTSLKEYDVDLSLLHDANGDGNFDVVGSDTDRQIVTNTCGAPFTITEDVDYFIVSYKEGDDTETRVLEVSKVNGDNEVSFKEYNGATVEENLLIGDRLDVGETVLELLDAYDNNETVVLEITSSNCDNNLYTEEGLQISLPMDENNTEFTITEEDGNENIAGAQPYKVVSYFDSSNEPRVAFVEFNANLSGGQLFEDGNYNVGYIESEVSSKIMEDDDNEAVTIIYPGEETYGAFFIGSKASKAITKANGEENVVLGKKIEVGAAVLDTSLSIYTNQNLIVVGGPAINRAAASLLGKQYPAYGTDSGITENSGIIKLIEQTNGNVALIVAGWEAGDTQRACRVLAEHNQYDFDGDEVIIYGTSMTDINVGVPVVNYSQ